MRKRKAEVAAEDKAAGADVRLRPRGALALAEARGQRRRMRADSDPSEIAADS